MSAPPSMDSSAPVSNPQSVELRECIGSFQESQKALDQSFTKLLEEQEKQKQLLGTVFSFLFPYSWSSFITDYIYLVTFASCLQRET